MKTDDHEATPSILVLGIGNVLWADEGFGVRAVEALHQRYTFAEAVTVMDGGTQGLYLLPYVQSCECLLVIDAIDYGLAPGSVHVVRDDAVPSFMGAKKMSLHQTGFQEVLAAAQLLGWQPQRVMLVGVQPSVLDDYGGSLRPEIAARIDEVIRLVVDELASWGARPQLRSERGPGHSPDHQSPIAELAPSALALHHYENMRPSPRDACRVGDPRFLARDLGHPDGAHGDPSREAGSERDGVADSVAKE
ncbi:MULTISPECIES: HyaD/HybD family hydrogenase maturation endopeptidase [unclassified Halomonas]|uniref:HyaD/HybD family hydrogenase maturation endopeptidase n=1 Tax=unclassified Halomonas TaxID=2609666 RepID=UPI0020976E67|nr:MULTISPECIES: HyaD/HybD family hydrogenase maturation endopeptidase [unclassified Halomonas]MCO7217803.1 HyaD/HybD family hydrogenase maturation endopeptidase [Halomonas sp. OfavH-34-E]